MKISVLTLFPEQMQRLTDFGVLGQAIDKSVLQIQFINPRDFTDDVHKTVDDRPFGGGDGMLMMAQPLHQALLSVADFNQARKIYLSPQGKKLDDSLAQSLAQEGNIILICGRYGGIDQRFLNQHQLEEVSIGDYVLSGGELAAAVLIDAVSRFVPGVLGHKDSAWKDSFREGWLEHPNFTRPRDWMGQETPPVLLSGNHQQIDQWKMKMAQLMTLQKRPDLFWQKKLSDQELRLLKDFYGELPDNEKQYLGLKLCPSDFTRLEK